MWSDLLHPGINFLMHASLLRRLCLLLRLSQHSLQFVRWHHDIWQSHEHVKDVRLRASFIACLAIPGTILCLLRGHDAVGVEDVFPGPGDLIVQGLSAKMVKYSSSVDGIEENGRGPQHRVIRNPERRTRRMCTVSEIIWIVRLEEMCCTPCLCWRCGEVDVACVHGKVGRLHIGAIGL